MRKFRTQMRPKLLAKRLSVLVFLLIGTVFLHQIWKASIYGSEMLPFENMLNRDKLAKVTDFDPELTLGEIINSIKGGIQVSLWYEVCSDQLHILKVLPGFPMYPDKEFITDSLDIQLGVRNIVLRLFGYILTKVTGMYQFRIEKNNTGEVEIWVSTNHVTKKSVLVQKRFSGEKSSKNYESAQIFLEKENLYYLEILHATKEMIDRIVVSWRLRGNEDFEILNKNHVVHYTGVRKQTQYSSPNLHNAKMPSKITKDPREQIPYLERLPQEKYSKYFLKCSEELNQLDLKEVEQFEGRWKVQESKVYIKTFMDIKENLYGGPVIEKSEVDTVIRNFLITVKTNGKVFRDFNLINLEKLSTEGPEERYLLEARINLVDNPAQNYLLSQYINFVDQTYCFPTVTPDTTAFINIVVTVKDQNRWIRFFLNNINEIYEQTNDAQFGVIIVDFNSQDINMYEEIKSTLLIEHYNYIQLKSKEFNKVMGLNLAIQSITNRNDIIFTCDLHLDLPMYTLETIRTHTIQGVSVFSPLVKRLDCNVWTFEEPGWWDQLGYGLVSMYKSDWLSIGGMNNDFGMRHAGEDWELVDRVLRKGFHMHRYRMPGLVYYEHPRVGKWYNG